MELRVISAVFSRTRMKCISKTVDATFVYDDIEYSKDVEWKVIEYYWVNWHN